MSAGSSTILLYNGSGASPLLTDCLEKQAKAICDPNLHRVQRVNSCKEMMAYSDPKSIAAVFVPGGSYPMMSLQEEPFDGKNFVEFLANHSIAYYGVCAGGIIGSKMSHGALEASLIERGFNQNSRTAVNSVYPGGAFAPLFERESVLFNNLKLVKLKSCDERIGSLSSAFILGPGFLDCDKIPGARSLAAFEEMSPVRFATRKGMMRFEEKELVDPSRISESVFYQAKDKAPVVLTGSHYELDSQVVVSEMFKDSFSTTLKQQTQLSKQMKEGDCKRMMILSKNFKMLGLGTIKS